MTGEESSGALAGSQKPHARVVSVPARDDAAVALAQAAVCTLVARYLREDAVSVRLPVAAGGGRRRHLQIDGTLQAIAQSILQPPATGQEGITIGDCSVTFLGDGEEAVEHPDRRPGLVVRVGSIGVGQVRLELARGSRVPVDLGAATMLRHVEGLLREACANPVLPARQVPFLDEGEARRLLVEHNDTHQVLCHAGTLHEEFLTTAERQSDAVAVREAAGCTLTFAQVAARIRLMSERLAALGVQRGTRVAVYQRPSAGLLISALAANRAGAAYVPLDPVLPAERRRAMLVSADCCALITTRALRAEAVAAMPFAAPVLCVDDPDDGQSDLGVDPAPVSTEDLCYVMFTSGSTGAPKGIALRHRGVLNNLVDLRQRCAIGRGDAVLTLSSPAFDMSVVELIGVPLAGGTAVVPEPSRASSPSHWAELVDSAQITIWNTVPALAEAFVGHLELTDRTVPGLRLAVMSGDWVPLDLPDRLRTRSVGMEVLVLGGATEASVFSTVHRVGEVDPAWSSIPYGTPMTNQRVYVLDADRRPVPVGVPGELHLAGTGLAQGYVGDCDHDRFELWHHPLVGTERIYRTGDLVVWRDDGQLEILGRVDLQLKIHGVRLEARAIEAELCRHHLVRDAAVLVIGTAERRRRLTAFVVPETGSHPSSAELRDFLALSLAPREVPSVFVFRQSLPLSPSGKVDRKALRDSQVDGGEEAGGPDSCPAEAMPELSDHGDRPTASIKALQARISAVWSRALDTEVIDVDTNFFLMGGDSFTAVTIIDQIHPELSLQDLFAHPTVTGLARRMQQLDLSAEVSRHDG